MAIPVPEGTYEAVAAAVKQCHGNIAEAARLLGASDTTTKSRVKAALRLGLFTEADLASWRRQNTPTLAQHLPQTADECWAVLDAAIGRHKDRKPPKAPARSKFSDKRIAVAGDFHAPYQHPEAVAMMLAETQGYDQIVINGDLQDHYAVSRYPKHEYAPFHVEMAAVDSLLDAFSGAYPDVLIVEGNHDKPRFEKALRTKLSLDEIHVIEYLSGGNLSAIRVAAKRFPNVRLAQVQVDRYKVGWFAQEGDLLMAHAEKYSKTPGSALRGIDGWFTDLHESLGLEPWTVLIQAHTHMGCWFPWKSDRLLVEGLCMTRLHGYMLDARIAGAGQRLGYVTLTQRDGVTDLRSVQPQWLDPQLRAA